MKEFDRVGKYIVLFAIVYGVLQPTVALLLNRQMNSISHFMVLFLAAGYPIYRFHKEHNRIYDDSAGLLLIIGTSLCAVLIDSIIFSVGLLLNVKPGFDFLLIQFGNVFSLSWLFGRLARRIYKEK